eukprot:5593113-Pyramimonas_sp.AAC.1
MGSAVCVCTTRVVEAWRVDAGRALKPTWQARLGCGAVEVRVDLVPDFFGEQLGGLRRDPELLHAALDGHRGGVAERHLAPFLRDSPLLRQLLRTLPCQLLLLRRV